MAGPGIALPGPALLADPSLLQRTLEELPDRRLTAFWEASGRTVRGPGGLRWGGELVELRGGVLDALHLRSPRRYGRVTRATAI